MHLGLASFTNYHELTQMDGFPLNIYFRWGHGSLIVLLWGRREERGKTATFGTQSIPHHAAYSESWLH